MTVTEALAATRDLLYGISVPAYLKEQVTDKILIAAGNIQECLNAIAAQKMESEKNAAEEKAEEAEEAAHEMEVEEIEPAEEA